MSEYLKAWEAEIRADERAKMSKLLGRLYGMASQICQLTAATSPRQDGLAKAPKSPEGARKRAPVSASSEQINVVFECIRSLQVQVPGQYYSPKALCGATGLGPKTVGAALRALERSGNVIEKGRKYAITTHDGENGIQPSLIDPNNE